ncbi:MAG: alpha/beta hydrolase [Eubacteriales bacterium]|nr:alpha/beta hydrolase [Eubacteriales bacterium]
MNIILKKLSESAKTHEALTARKWQESTDLPEGLRVVDDLPYSGPDGAELAADLYFPAEPAPSGLPVIVMVHGGGLFAGTRKINRNFCAKIAGTGCLVYSLEYRLLTDTDAFGEISDLCAGFSFVKKTMRSYGGDPGRVFVAGESAGAFLTVYATALARSGELSGRFGCPPHPLKIRGLVCFSGMFYTTRTDLIGAVYKKDLYGDRLKDKDFRQYLNPEHPEVVNHLPPVMLTSSGSDFLKGYTLRYAKALRAAGHPCRLLYYPEGKHLGHAFPSLQPELAESAEVRAKIKAWTES